MQKKVLIIEDSRIDADIVKELLESSNVITEVAQNGEDGLRAAEKTRPDLIILDLMLPGMSGFEVCEKLKKNSKTSGATVVILTVRDEVDDINKAFRAGADDYIIKPPNPEFLVRKIKLYLSVK
ncbi:MAG: response regulator [Candidatus Omnitrophica bacterium]|nr:response regulator [Candidatus Omnitrophota bacterium]